MNKVYIIILNFNGWQDTIECLESVLKSDYGNYQVIVVDNDSPNNSMDYIINWAEGKQEVIYAEDSQLKHLSQPFEAKPLEYLLYTKEEALQGGDARKELAYKDPLIFIPADENGGFAAGNNIGIRYALAKDDFEYIWLLNNDTVIEKDSLSALLTHAMTYDIGICGSTLMYYHDKDKVQAYGGAVNKFFGTGSHILNKKEIEKKLDYVVGASFLIQKNVIDEVGLLPEEYFLYYEETDYCFNAKKHGFTLGVALDSVVYHKEGASTGANEDTNVRSEFIDVLSLKNRITFHKKYLGGGIGLWSGMMIAFANRIKRGQVGRIWKVIL